MPSGQRACRQKTASASSTARGAIPCRRGKACAVSTFAGRQLSHFHTAASIAAGLLALATAPTAFGAAYAILDLGTLGGAFSRTEGYGVVNALGQVVGVSRNSDNLDHAFRSTAGGAINSATGDLGTLGGFNSSAYGINASGQVVGSADTGGVSIHHAFRTTATGKVNDAGANLGTFPGGTLSVAYGINASGQTVGYADTASRVDHAFRTSASGKVSDAGTDLGTLGGPFSFAFGINASGQTVGYSDITGDTAHHAFRTSATGKISDPGTDLGTLGGNNSAALGINDLGQTIGSAYLAGNAVFHAFRATDTGKISDPGSDLGTLGGSSSEAYAINALGQVVGISDIAGNAGQHAFFEDITGPMQDLNTLIPSDSGWVLQEAHGINDSGQIAGFGMLGTAQHAFLLTPTPEPGIAGFAGVMVAALLLRHRRRSGRA
jgi:probable HAF family extracellular repeat protein